MTDNMKYCNSVIMTIPGNVYINGGMILGEMGDIHRFSNHNKLLAFVGFDPSVYQEGNFQTRRTRILNIPACLQCQSVIGNRFLTVSMLHPVICLNNLCV